MAEEDAGYLRCEQDVIAWLMTQTPVPVCQGLVMRMRDGAHRGCGPELDRQWEIPVTFIDPDNLTAPVVAMTKAYIRTLGGELTMTDAGKFVVVPMFRPVQEVQPKLNEVRTLASVGVAIRFVENRPVGTGEPLVHILHEGVTLCGYPTGFPKDWPEGKFVRLKEKGATCEPCISCSRTAWDPLNT
jgi:hypothetical protein